MKRHISVFAFLLGAFAAAFLPLTARAYRVYSWGYQLPDGTLIPDEEEESINLENLDYPGQPLVSVGSQVNLSANFPKMENQGKGLSVDYWLAQMTFPGSSFAGTKIQGSDGKNPYAWTCANDDGVSYFAVKCKYITYNLKYDANGGSSVSVDKTGVSYTNKFALAEAPTRMGYEFGGWYDRNGAGDPHAAGDFVSGASFAELDNVHTNGATVTLKAIWTAKNYNVKGEGSNCTVTVAARAAYDGDLTIFWTPDGPWVKPMVTVYSVSDDKRTKIRDYLDLDEGTTSMTFKMSDLRAYYGEITIKVSYDVHTLTFNPCGGTCDEKSRRVEHGESIGTLPIPKMHQKQYDGWWDDQAQGNQITATSKLTEDIMVYAHWTDVTLFKIDTFADPPEGGSLTGGGQFEKNAQTVLTATASNGYSFVKWTAKTSGAEWFNREWPITVSGGEEYTAFFTGNVCKVIFMAPEGTPPKQERFVTYGSEYGDLPTATWTEDESDMAFAGWNTDPDGEGDMIFSNTVVRTANKQTLYAMWKEIPTYHVAFDGNGATSGSMATQKMYCGVASNLTLNAFARDGYHFRGWATNEADAAELRIAYEDGELVTDIAPTNETVTLYAVWESISLAEAMHCDNLVWTNTTVGSSSVSPWYVDYGVGRGSNTQSCVTQSSSTKTPYALTSSVISKSGMLSFQWRPEGGNGDLWVWIDGTPTPSAVPTKEGEYIRLSGSDGIWSLFMTNIVVVTGSKYVHFVNLAACSCSIDLMTWTPSGLEPEEKDAVTISSAVVSDGKFTLSFEFNEDFDYLLKTNANLLIDSWGVMEIEGTKTDNILTFEPEIIEGQPQLFYKVETIRKEM